MQKACEYIPKDQWRETPIALRATAGLRLLSNEVAQSILDEVFIIILCCLTKLYNKVASIIIE